MHAISRSLSRGSLWPPPPPPAQVPSVHSIVNRFVSHGFRAEDTDWLNTKDPPCAFPVFHPDVSQEKEPDAYPVLTGTLGTLQETLTGVLSLIQESMECRLSVDLGEAQLRDSSLFIPQQPLEWKRIVLHDGLGEPASSGDSKLGLELLFLAALHPGRVQLIHGAWDDRSPCRGFWIPGLIVAPSEKNRGKIQRNNVGCPHQDQPTPKAFFVSLHQKRYMMLGVGCIHCPSPVLTVPRFA